MKDNTPLKGDFPKTHRIIRSIKDTEQVFNNNVFHWVNKYVYVLIYLFLILVGGVLYWMLDVSDSEGLQLEGFWNNIYFSIVTITSLGYGDYSPRGSARVISSMQVLSGLGVFAYAISAITNKRSDRILDILRAEHDAKELKEREEVSKEFVTKLNKETNIKNNDPGKLFTNYDDNELIKRASLHSLLTDINLQLRERIGNRVGKYRVSLTSTQVKNYAALLTQYKELAEALGRVYKTDYFSSVNNTLAINALFLLQKYCKKLQRDLSNDKLINKSIYADIQKEINISLNLLHQEREVCFDNIYNGCSGKIKENIVNGFEGTSLSNKILELSKNKAEIVSLLQTNLSPKGSVDEYSVVLGDMKEELGLNNNALYDQCVNSGLFTPSCYLRKIINIINNKKKS